MEEDRLERLTNLVTFLLDAGSRRGPGATYADIVTTIPGYPPGDDTRRRAFERDKKLLRDEDIPLVEQDGHYRIPPDEYYLPDLALTEDEQLALQLAVAAVPLGEGGQAGGAALQKLTLSSGVGGTGASRSLAGHAAAMADLDEHPLLPRLHAAIRARSTVTFTRDGATRTLEPALLYFRDGNWYLHGYDRFRHQPRSFRVDRIDAEGDVEIGPPAAFEARAAEDAPTPGEAVPRQSWLWSGEGAGDKREEAVVRVDAVLAAKAIAEAGPSAMVERHDDGSVTLTLPVTRRRSLREWVLEFLDHAEVVAPPAMRADVVEWLRAMAG